jgi:hypothetical protein
LLAGGLDVQNKQKNRRYQNKENAGYKTKLVDFHACLYSQPNNVLNQHLFSYSIPARSAWYWLARLNPASLKSTHDLNNITLTDASCTALRPIA